MQNLQYLIQNQFGINKQNFSAIRLEVERGCHGLVWFYPGLNHITVAGTLSNCGKVYFVGE